ncbi:SPOR domain-containing protein [Aestuariicella sp. G3-2]|uniref:SPOR domain-containing protein n=1 Tax=Pseudomaricurvus albidus TaxID=2842452 RepID=UPI001C0AFCB7|nr:SPOR domain-containing protein [Aestuariicella albida]
MENGLKQRLVGALVLLALGVLFVPILFEPEDRRTVDRVTQIPAAPEIQPMQVDEPTRNPDIEPIKPADQQYHLLPEQEPAEQAPPEVAAEVETAEAPKPEPAPTKALVSRPAEPERQILDKNGVPKAWLVQVASFSSDARAEALRDKLLKDDFPAFTRSFETSKGKVTRVYVGPKISRDKASVLKQTLDKSLKINSLIVSFSP